MDGRTDGRTGKNNMSPDPEEAMLEWLVILATVPRGKLPALGAYLSHLVRKPTICICKNKDADRLRGNREADQRLCFCFTDSTLPLLHRSEISGF